MKLLLKLFHQSYLSLLWIQFFSLFQTVELVLFSVHNRQVEQFLFVSSLGYRERYTLQLHIYLLRYNNLF